MDQIAKIGVEACAVTSIGMIRKIFDSDYTKLPNCCKGVNLRRTERIGSVAFVDFRALAYRKDCGLLTITGEGWAVGFCMLAIELIGAEFRFAELAKSHPDAGIREGALRLSAADTSQPQAQSNSASTTTSIAARFVPHRSWETELAGGDLMVPHFSLSRVVPVIYKENAES
jgi:hypothetical protein